MANLILKPSAGGVLKIQNQDGTVDALSVNTAGNLTAAGTLGVTGAVTTSSTLGVTGNTTLAGTANALGTVASGNISNTAIVYPAGHVVQTTTRFRDETFSSLGTQGGNGTFLNTVVTGTITPKYDDSSIIIFCNFSSQVGDNSGDHGIGFRIVKTGTGVTSLHGSPRIGPVDGDTQSEGHSSYYYNPHNGTTQIVLPNQLVMVDNDCETTNTITYTLQCILYNVGSNCKIGGNEWDNYDWSIFFQEIKR